MLLSAKIDTILDGGNYFAKALAGSPNTGKIDGIAKISRFWSLNAIIAHVS